MDSNKKFNVSALKEWREPLALVYKCKKLCILFMESLCWLKLAINTYCNPQKESDKHLYLTLSWNCMDYVSTTNGWFTNELQISVKFVAYRCIRCSLRHKPIRATHHPLHNTLRPSDTHPLVSHFWPQTAEKNQGTGLGCCAPYFPHEDPPTRLWGTYSSFCNTSRASGLL